MGHGILLITHFAMSTIILVSTVFIVQIISHSVLFKAFIYYVLNKRFMLK